MLAPSNVRYVLLWGLPLFVLWIISESPLIFAPVPWPDDAAFYFVAKEFFRWPPRWVMLPQAPFEPTYGIFNFNTMPFYPILLGLGRWMGIDGIALIKIWPLAAWALSSGLLGSVLYHQGLSFWIALFLVLCTSLDPVLRWGSVLVRPESFIGLCGMALVLGLAYGFPKRFQPKKYWDPIAALLAIAAYSHFNAIHLVWPVVFTFLFSPRYLFQICWKTLLYLTPWLVSVVWHFDLFVTQMKLQWSRCHVYNPWFSSILSALTGLFQSMGNPTSWVPELFYAGYFIFGLIFFGMLWIALDGFFFLRKYRFSSLRRVTTQEPIPFTHRFFFPGLIWVLSAMDLFTSLPESWFVYYVHIAFWCFAGLFIHECIKKEFQFSRFFQMGFIGLLSILCSLFAYVNGVQWKQLSRENTWNWDTYQDFIACIDSQLVALERELGFPKPFRVWSPTPPDVTIELSRLHPDWSFTRTNDFSNRNELAVRHGWEVEAVVQAETVHVIQRTVSGKPSDFPEIQSAWMPWRGYYLYPLWEAPHWKPNRFICQRGRWVAFLFMKNHTSFMRSVDSKLIFSEKPVLEKPTN